MLHFELEKEITEAYKQQKNAGYIILLGASLQDFYGPNIVLAFTPCSSAGVSAIITPRAEERSQVQ